MTGLTYGDALRELETTKQALDDLQAGYELIHGMAKWMADRVPELAAAAQHAAMMTMGFTSVEQHEGMTFGMSYGSWRAICSCGWVSETEKSIAYARAVHEDHFHRVTK